MKLIKVFSGKTPKIAKSTFISEAAYVIGDVEIGENSSVWPGAIIRADFSKIKIGNFVDVEDNCVLHVVPDTPMEIGNNVVITHNAMVHARYVGNNVFIGINSTILPYSEIGDSCVIAANTVVLEGMKVPDGSFVAGVPGKIKGKATEKQLSWVKWHPQVYPQLAKQYKEQGL